MEQEEGPDDQEPEEKVRVEADHPHGAYSKRATDDGPGDWER